MADVLVNIKGNTQQATEAINQTTDAVENLNNTAGKAASGVDDLEASLKRQEANIKIIDGAVNLLGGSIEVAVGTLGLLGVDEGIIEDFEKTALSAIAFADGTKRALDGVKSLNEGLSNYGGIAGVARKAQAALNAAVAANPWILAAAAVAALGAALIAYYNAQVDAEEATKSGTAAVEAQLEAKKKLKEETDRLREADTEYAKSLGDESKELQRQLNLLQAKGASEDEIYSKKKELIQSEINDLNRRLGNIAGNAELENEIRNQILDATNKLDVAQAEYDRKRIENSKKAVELLKQEKTEILNIRDARKKEDETNKAAVESFIQGLGGIQQESGKVQQSIGGVVVTTQQATQALANPLFPPLPLPELEQQAATFADYLGKLNVDLNEFFEGNTAQSISATLGTAAMFAKTLADSQDDSTKEGFESSKKYKIASVVTSAIQSSFEAFGAAQQFGPILGPILGLAQVAAIGIASNKAIQDIKKSTFQSPGSSKVSAPSGGGASARASAAGGPPQVPSSFLPGGFLAAPPVGPAARPEPVRAYVVTGDVTNGQQAEEQLQRRRALGPG